jgi:hypothetical protein
VENLLIIGAAGVEQIVGDLDAAASLAPRGRGAMLPRRFAYLCTNGVCGTDDSVPRIEEAA